MLSSICKVLFPLDQSLVSCRVSSHAFRLTCRPKQSLLTRRATTAMEVSTAHNEQRIERDELVVPALFFVSIVSAKRSHARRRETGESKSRFLRYRLTQLPYLTSLWCLAGKERKMARTRGGRVRAAGGGGDDGGVSESTASESEVVIASSSAGEGSAIPSESDGEGLDKKTRRTSPRKRDTSVISNNDTIAAPQIASSSAASAARKRPFKPARSARKTTQSHSSAAKRRALEVFNASNNNNNNSNDTTSESDDELAITSSAAKRLAAPSSVMPFGNHRDISDSEEDEVHNEMALRAARFTSQRIANDMNATTTDEEEDEGDETIWVPVRSGSQIPSNGSTSLLSTSLKRKNPPSSSSSRNRDGSENGTPKPTIAGAPTLRQLAQKARIILENAMHDTSFHLSSQDKDTLSDFLGCKSLHYSLCRFAKF